MDIDAWLAATMSATLNWMCSTYKSVYNRALLFLVLNLSICHLFFANWLYYEYAIFFLLIGLGIWFFRIWVLIIVIKNNIFIHYERIAIWIVPLWIFFSKFRQQNQFYYFNINLNIQKYFDAMWCRVWVFFSLSLSPLSQFARLIFYLFFMFVFYSCYFIQRACACERKSVWQFY